MNNVCNLVIFKSCLSSTSFHFKGLRIRDVVAVLRRPRAADTVLLSSLGDENSSQRSSLRSARGRRVCVFTRFAGNEIKKKPRHHWIVVEWNAPRERGTWLGEFVDDQSESYRTVQYEAEFVNGSWAQFEVDGKRADTQLRFPPTKASKISIDR